MPVDGSKRRGRPPGLVSGTTVLEGGSRTRLTKKPLCEQFPGYHLVKVPIERGGDMVKGAVVREFLMKGYVILSEDPFTTMIVDHILMGIPQEEFDEAEAIDFAERNAFGAAGRDDVIMLRSKFKIDQMQYLSKFDPSSPGGEYVDNESGESLSASEIIDIEKSLVQP